MKKYRCFLSILLYLCLVSGCSHASNTNPIDWIPDITPPAYNDSTVATADATENNQGSDNQALSHLLLGIFYGLPLFQVHKPPFRQRYRQRLGVAPR